MHSCVNVNKLDSQYACTTLKMATCTKCTIATKCLQVYLVSQGVILGDSVTFIVRVT